MNQDKQIEDLYKLLGIKEGQYVRFDMYVESCRSDIKEHSIKTSFVEYVLNGLVYKWDELASMESRFGFNNNLPVIVEHNSDADWGEWFDIRPDLPEFHPKENDYLQLSWAEIEDLHKAISEFIASKEQNNLDKWQQSSLPLGGAS